MAADRTYGSGGVQMYGDLSDESADESGYGGNVIGIIVATVHEEVITNRKLADTYPQGCTFVGHMSPDTDTICTAFAAAELYNGSYVAPSEMNRETQFVFDTIGLTYPVLLGNVADKNNQIYCLVDHNQQTQSPLEVYNIPRNQMKGILDHHAIQSNAMTHDSPIHVDIRPWGCASTILYTHYELAREKPSYASAKCMLSAILSDTLGLTSIITTDQDIEAADKLAKITETEDTNEYYFEMGVAKSNISGYTTNDVVTIDSKVFDFTWSTGDICKTTWGTFETFSPMDVMSNVTAYWEAVVEEKAKSGNVLYFFSVVDSYRSSLELKTNISWLFLASDDERHVAAEAYGVTVNPTDLVVDLSPLNSRKLDFVPPLVQCN